MITFKKKQKNPEKERFCFGKLKFSYFLKISSFSHHFGEESRRLLTKVWSSTEADNHTKSNFSMI